MNQVLAEDIYSHFKQGQKDFFQYGKKGDQVKVISDCGNVLVVENKNGFRFPVESIKVKTIELIGHGK